MSLTRSESSNADRRIVVRSRHTRTATLHGARRTERFTRIELPGYRDGDRRETHETPIASNPEPAAISVAGVVESH